MKLFSKFSIGLLCIVMFFSCNRKYETPTIVNGNFAPVAFGKYIIYDVDSSYWDNFSKTYTVKKSQMKYECTDSFRDESGRLSFVITITRKDDSTAEFKEDNVVTITVTDHQMEWVQKNLRFLSLVFPIEENKSWNGLTFINREDEANKPFASYDWNFTYKEVGKSFKSGTTTFKNTITVNQIDSKTNEPDGEYYAEQTFSKEVYADSIGLVYKEYIYWTYQPTEAYRIGNGVKMTFNSSNW